MRRRSGFTLVELLVAISIVLLLAVLVFGVFSVRNSDKMRSAARVAQSAFLGAKDRALHAKDLRGVRLTRDTTDNMLVNGFVYLQPLPMLFAGNVPGQTPVNTVALVRPGLLPPNVTGSNDATVVWIVGNNAAPKQSGPGQRWFLQDSNGIWPYSNVQIRIPSGTGQWMNLARQQTSPPYWGTMTVDQMNQLSVLQLTLQVPYQGTPAPGVFAVGYAGPGASCDIQLGNDIMPFHQPISLSSGIVIDLRSSSPNVQNLSGAGALAPGAPAPYFDIMFSPRGAVSGFLAGQGPLHFMLRDLRDATALPNLVNPATAAPFPDGWIVGVVPGDTRTVNGDPHRGDRMILSVFPQTGLVQAFDMDVTDLVNNVTGSVGPDGYADNPFNFAQQGRSAGR